MNSSMYASNLRRFSCAGHVRLFSSLKRSCYIAPWQLSSSTESIFVSAAPFCMSAIQAALPSHVALSLHGSSSSTPTLTMPKSSSTSSSSAVASPSLEVSLFPSLSKHWQLSTSLSSLGLPPAEVLAIVNALPPPRRPKDSPVSSYHLVALVQFLQSIDADTSEVAVLVNRAPFMYQRNPKEHLEPKIAFLETLGVDRREMHVLILKYPYSLYPSLEDIRRQIRFLRDLPLTDEDLRKVIRQRPMAFRLGAGQYLQPKVELFKSLGITPRDIVKVVLTFPRVFGRSLDKLQETVGIMQEYGFHPGTLSFSKIFVCVATRDTDSVRLVVQTLFDCGLSQEQITSLIQGAPIILAKNATDIHNKIKYVVDVMGRPVTDVVKFPAFFLISLEGRIKRRHQAFLKWRAESNASKQLSLSYIYSPKDEVFLKRFPGIKLEIYASDKSFT